MSIRELFKVLLPNRIKLVKWEEKHRLIPHIVVFCILSFLAAKVVFRSHSANSIFWFYGISVTLILCLTFIVSFTRYKDPYVLSKKAKKSPIFPGVSCLVAAYNEEDMIEGCIHSLAGQTYKKKEIIVVNDASTDGTAAVLDRLARIYNIRVIHLEKNVGKKGALVQGVLAARGSIYAFTDSDSSWEPTAIEKIVEIFRADPKVGAVSGHTRASNAEKNILTKVQDCWYEGQYSIRKAYESVFSSVTCISGPLAVFRKEAIFNYMPAWQHDRFLGQEFRFATDRTLTAIALGSKYIGPKLLEKYPDERFTSKLYPTKEWKVVYCKAARAWTHVPDTLPKVFKQQARWKKSFLRNIFYTGAFYWRRPFPTSLVYYMHVAFVLAGPFIAFRHLVYLPLHGDLNAVVLYLAGISFIGFMFGLAFKLENPKSHKWIYRPLMSMFSTLILSWLLFYSMATIKKMSWSRG